MSWVVFSWAILALLLIVAEVTAPGTFMLWLGFAAGAVFFLVLIFPDLSLLAQAIMFVVLSFIFIQIYRKWFRRSTHITDKPMLNQRAMQLIGHIAALSEPIVFGHGRVQIADAYWDVTGSDMPAGTVVKIVAIDEMTLQVVCGNPDSVPAPQNEDETNVGNSSLDADAQSGKFDSK